VLEGGTDPIADTELRYDDVQPPSSVGYTVTSGAANGQLELTSAPGVSISAFTQGDINGGLLVYVHDGSNTTSDSFGFDVGDGLGYVLPGQSFAITIGPSAPEILELRVAASSDDAEERASGGVRLPSRDLELVYHGSNQTVGMRFNGVSIPREATIVNAYLQFQVDETTSVATSLTIEGENIGDAPTFGSSKRNISSRTRTAAAVSWSPVPWTTVGEAGPDQRTPDVSSVVQEIVNGSEWSSGNSLVVIITGTGERVAEAYDGDSAGAPLLHVEYSSGP
jgi:hypothetical protein